MFYFGPFFCSLWCYTSAVSQITLEKNVMFIFLYCIYKMVIPVHAKLLFSVSLGANNVK